MARKADIPESPEPAEGLETQLAQLRADLAQMAETLTALAQSQGSAMSARLGEEAHKLRDTAEAQLAALQAQAEPKLAEARAYVQTNPLQALGMAAGAGLIFGLLFGRR